MKERSTEIPVDVLIEERRKRRELEIEDVAREQPRLEINYEEAYHRWIERKRRERAEKDITGEGSSGEGRKPREPIVIQM